MELPMVDVSLLGQDSNEKSIVIKQIQEACQTWGAFHVINHGVSEAVIQAAMEVNRNFFDLPEMMKKEILELGSRDMFSPVKLLTFQRSARGSDLLQRDLVRLYANPFEDFIDFWPTHPADYREKMGRYTKDVRKLGITLFGAIMESLNLGPTHLQENFDKGMHMVIANSYSPPTPESSIKIGVAPHSDHGIITILLQSSPGLEVLDMADGKWKALPCPEGSLQVLVGDHLELLSNGIYKSVFHRATLSTRTTRMSLASFHNFELDEVVEPATELTAEDCPKRYEGCSTRDLIKDIYSGEVGRLIDRLKI
ncbi:2-oxoglutarate-dependent dioxygenase 21, chloroplastic-like [Coffea arabica]|uniref:2-oxoglutarate-dependent dioxygenase 21, chloroplastic-like n=1 Tax=Coffea arabica TaxID=13443 RepID=A0A6P6TRD2_COFAR